jgi:hypothetical protein
VLPSPRAVTGHRALSQHRFDDFQRLRVLRGGFVEGTRTYACLIYFSILRKSGLDRTTIEREVKKLAGECKPPLPSVEVDRILTNTRSFWRCRDLTIAEMLRVTDKEAIEVPRWGSGRLTLPCPAPIETSPNVRRAVIQQIVLELGRWPSCREMAQILHQQGIQVGHVTISTDYRLLKPSPALPLLEGGS